MPGRPRATAFRYDSLDAYEEQGYQARPTKTKATYMMESKRVRVGVATMQGWRKTMEDAVNTCVEGSGGGAVQVYTAAFDGHNGDSVARYCQDSLRGLVYGEMESVGDTESPPNSALRSAVQSAFIKADENAKSTVSGESVGCTAVVLLLTADGRLVCAHAGDARCVLSRGGTAIPLSCDHKGQLECEAERVRSAGGVVTDGRVVCQTIKGRLAVTRAIGDWVFKHVQGKDLRNQPVTALPDVAITTLVEGDEFAVLASDGIWDQMSSDDAVAFIRERLQGDDAGDLSAVCSELCDRCLGPKAPGRGSDNMCVVLVQFSSGGQDVKPAAETTSPALFEQWQKLGLSGDYREVT
eukprot:TRINITY_DN2315_c4_g1_i8.p1 TRINITY_DN2315_c4_g1~~TRINITY_DN2315_c4_g1_i8.p1  ORF type:complete len:353 (+),score=68.70 TRINITY_DN2315_c4_g1_i8:174-1232(+)